VASVERLYTPEVLALATGLAAYPFDPDMDHLGSARSPSCGSTVALSLRLDEAGRIGAVGVKAHACAIGQAAAAIFAAVAPGQDRPAIAAAAEAIGQWLAEGGALPEWAGLSAIAAAQSFPGRHGAILLPWKAALEALSSASAPR